MRPAAALATVVLAVLGLLTWEAIALGLSTVALLLALWTLHKVRVQANDIADLREIQAERIAEVEDRLADHLGAG